jgi:hypothetical protein
MASLFEGIGLLGKAVNVKIEPDKNGKPRVKWDMEVTEGQHAGKHASYSGKLDEAAIKWTKRDMIAIGWQGKDVRTFVADVTAANKIVPFEAQIASTTYADSGKTAQWTSAKSIGFTPRAPGVLEDSKLDDMNKWFAEAPAIGPQGDDTDTPF